MTFKLLACAALVVLVASGCSMERPQLEQTQSTAILAKIPETTDARFEKEVIDSNVPVLVDFYATWCQPCKKMEPILADLATMYDGKVKLVRVDVEKNPELAKRYRINAVPHLMLFKNGDLVDDVLGMTSRERLSYSLDRTL